MRSLIGLISGTFLVYLFSRVIKLRSNDRADWSNIRYFKPSEFDSPDAPGTGRLMNGDLIIALDNVRSKLGSPIRINSGYRTANYNASLESRGYNPSPNSAHLKGLAVDIHCPDLAYMKTLITEFRNLGFVRIGQYHTKSGNYFIHVDNDRTKIYQGAWYRVGGNKTDIPLVT